MNTVLRTKWAPEIHVYCCGSQIDLYKIVCRATSTLLHTSWAPRRLLSVCEGCGWIRVVEHAKIPVHP